MNLRTVVAGLYMIMFVVTLLNMMIIPTLLQEVAPVLFTSLIMALLGILLSLWIYRDGEKIEELNSRIETLEKSLKEEKKK